jgi:hypothetical protein
LVDSNRSNYEYNQLDATLQVNLLFLVALHVSGDVFAHHQKHMTVFSAFGNVHQRRYRLVSWMIWNCNSKSSMTPVGNYVGEHYQKP